MDRGFNAGQTHNSIYPSIFKRLRAIARYWSEITTFPTSLAFNAPVVVFPLEFREKCGPHKTRIMEAVKTVWRWIEPFRHNTFVWRTNGRTDGQPIAITCAVILTHVKNKEKISKENDRQNVRLYSPWNVGKFVESVNKATNTLCGTRVSVPLLQK